MTKVHKLEKVNQSTMKEEAEGSKKFTASNLGFSIKKKFETVVIRHSISTP
jgi:hypothetical protein